MERCRWSHDELKACVQAAVERHGVSSTVTQVSSAPSEYSSWYASHIVTATFTDRPQIQLFLKDFGSYRMPKDDMASRRQRELSVYKNLLSDRELGTPRYFGCSWDDRRERYWLLLEYVDGLPVRYRDFKYWTAAAAWLARLQAFASEHLSSLADDRSLLRHDIHFFQATADGALDGIRGSGGDLAARVEPVIRDYCRALPDVAAQPGTLVHGAYVPAQIIVQEDQSTGLRVCPVDWELAAFGSPLYDFAFLVDGFEAEELDALWDAYRTEADGLSVDVPDQKERARLLSCFRCHKVLTWLSQARERNFSAVKLEKLVTLLESIHSSFN
jgi:hypothetical protein